MSHRIFLAGASGAIGRRLVPLLVRAGHRVTGTTRSPEKAAALASFGIEPVVVDVYDAPALDRVVAAAEPDVVIHQLTDLPAGLDPVMMPEGVIRNARMRQEGTPNLVAAALKAGAKRMIAQSIGWAYAPGQLPHGDDDPLDAGTMRAVVALETAVLQSGLASIVLRYGRLYGPGTGFDHAPAMMPLHVDAAAHAALLAIEAGQPGPYNVAEANPDIMTGRAEAELGWRADFRLPADLRT